MGQSTWRIVVAAVAGVGVLLGLTIQAGAHANEPSTPGYYMTLTAQASGTPASATSTVIPTATPNATVVGRSPTATIAVSGQQTSPNTIANGRGRIANVKDRSFSVVWTTDTESTGGINYGSNVSLGSPAPDQRGPTYSGVTHYVDVGNLQPSTTYFFDLQSGANIDNNNGQHYQVKTGPDIGQPSTNSYLTGGVSNPGGGSPAGFAVIWGVVRDTDNKPTGGSSQLLASFAGPDGRFQLSVVPRTADLGAFYQFSNQGDTIDLTARAAAGEKTVQIDTNILQSGGSAPADARVVLDAIGASAVTPTLIPPSATPVQNANPVATQTPMPLFSATPRPTLFPTPTFMPVFPPPSLEPRAPDQLPVQLPPLREMQIIPPVGSPIVTTFEGRVPSIVENGASARPIITAPQTGNVAPRPSGVSPLIGAAPPINANSPALPADRSVARAPAQAPDAAPIRVNALPQPSVVQVPLDQGVPIAAVPPQSIESVAGSGQGYVASSAPSGPVQSPGGGSIPTRGTGPAPVAGATLVGRSNEFGQTSPSSVRGAASVPGRGDGLPGTIADRGNRGAAPQVALPQVAPPAGWLDGLTTMHPLISLLFYGGLGLAVAGIAVAVYGLTSGSAGWRPR